MFAIGKGSTTDPSNPLLVFYAQQEGQMVDLAELSFQVFDQTTPDKRLRPVQIFPATNGDRQDVDLVTERLSLGYYAPAWTAPSSTAAGGRYTVRWFWKVATGDRESSARQVFEVLEGEPISGPRYALVSDLRGQCSEQKVSEVRLQAAILLASSQLENITGRYFEPRAALQRHDGGGARALLLNDPIIGVAAMAIDTQPSMRGDLPIALDELRIYNRHLTQRMTNPDDRSSPKIEFVHSRDYFEPRDTFSASFSGITLRSFVFPYGVQNVTVDGVFGYTEFDGTPFGKTPEVAQYVTRLLALRSIPDDDQCGEQIRNGWRVIEERTRDQMIRYADPRKFGQWTGDADIDVLLASLMRAPNLGSA
jgi:hypothetical protein